MLAMLKTMRIGLCRVLEFALIIAVIVLTLDVLWGVITRYVFGSQAKWTEELARFLLVWVSLLGGAAAFGEKAHLGVDYFFNLLEPSARRLLTILSYVAIIFFAVSVFIVGGVQLVQSNFASGQMAPALQINMGWVYAAVPVAGVFILLLACQQLIETMAEYFASAKEAN
ncbi:MAG: TRAP transporter small permease [Sedimentisphaerales bacterium]|nr:TRAP transporter small permease [Sedimentisphaerales bacterium]